MKFSDLWKRIHPWLGWGWFGVLCLLSIIIVLQILSCGTDGQYVGEAAAVREINEAVLVMKGTESKITLPIRLRDLVPGTEVALRFQFENRERDTYAEVRTAFAPLSVDVNNIRRFQFGAPGDRPACMKDPGTTIHMVPVKSSGMITVTLHYTSPVSRRSISIPSLYVSNQSGLLRRHLYQDGVTIMESAVMIIGGILLMAVSLLVIYLDKKGVLLLWLGAFVALTGLWGCSNCDIILFFVNDPNLWYFVSYLSFFSLLLPLEMFLEESVRFHHEKLLVALRYLLMGLLLAAVFLQFAGIIMFTQTAFIYQLLLPLSILALTFCVIYEAIRYRNRVAFLWMAPMGFISISCITELIRYQNSYGYSGAVFFVQGTMLFALFMCIVGGLQIRESIKISRREREHEYQLSLMNLEIGEQKKYQDTLMEHERELRRQRHDYRHQLTVLLEYVRSGQLDELEGYLNQLRGRIPSARNILYTESHAVNAIIAYYAQLAENAGGKVYTKISLPEDLSVSLEQNLCIIFGNLLENAAEAIQRMNRENDSADRFVRLVAVVHMRNLVIHMENSMTGRLRKWGRFYISSKREEVGIGLTSIANIASLYNGNIEFRSVNGKFISDVYLTMPES